jgi:DnaJ-class molecular chaperone
MDATLARWSALLDHIDYFALLQVRHDADTDTVNAAFRTFCSSFHPDGHRSRSTAERDTVLRIFQRGAEAQAVLADQELRALYTAALARGEKRLTGRAAPGAAQPNSNRPRTLQDAVKSPSAKQFARQVDEMRKAGNLQKARLALSLALNLEPENAVLLAAKAELEPPR